MAEMPRTSPAPMTEDAFIADRRRFWGAFTHFTMFSVMTMVIVLILMALFLV